MRGFAVATLLFEMSNFAHAQAMTPTTTSLAVTAAGNPVTTVTSGTLVTLTGTVKAGTTSLTVGQVNFCDASAAHCTDIHILGTAQLTSAGTATLKLRPATGSHSYKAVFLGTTSEAGSSSGSFSLSITAGQTPTVTTIAQSGYAGDYSLAATVSAATKNQSVPTGTISFLDTSNNDSVLATGTLVELPGQPLTDVNDLAVGNEPESVVVGDFNGDGNSDFAIGLTSASPTVGIFLGDGAGNFTQVVQDPITTSGAPALVADFNGDGIPDLVLASAQGGPIAILLGNGDGTFRLGPGSPMSNLYGSSPIVLGDFNGDGIPDLAAAGGYYLLVFLGNGDGSFTQVPITSATITQADLFTSMAVGDLNGDGIPDLVALNSSTSAVNVFLGNGDGTFTQLASGSIASAGSGPIALADFNGDGKLDLVLPFYGASPNVGVMLGNGNGTFQTAIQTPLTLGTSPFITSIADFNGDGIADIFLGAQINGQTLNILLGNGDGTFSQMSTGDAQLPCCSHVAVGDLNNDGLPGIISSSVYDGTAQILMEEVVQSSTTVSNIAPGGPGVQLIEASYPGDSNFKGSVSAVTSLTSAVTTPVITPASGTYTTVQTVSITDSTPGAAIYYSSPSTNGGFVAYTGPIQVTQEGTNVIQAYATATGYAQSNTVIATYVLNLPMASTPVISLAGGSYPSAQTVTITDSTPGAVIYYSVTGAFQSGATKYTGPISVSTSETLAVYATALGYSESSVTSAEYIINSSPSSFIYTVAGIGIPGYTGDGNPATLAELNGAGGVAVVPSGLANAGDLYIADNANNRIRKVAAGTGVISTVAGTGIGGNSGDNGPATSAQLLNPIGVAVDSAGNLWILDYGNARIRVVAAATGTITTANLNGLSPLAFALDGSNNLYVVQGSRVWEVEGSSNVLIAGTGINGFSGDGGPAINAALADPFGIALDSAGNVYIADTYNSVIRKVTRSTGVITTVAGVSTLIAGNEYSDVGYSGDGGPATSAKLDYPYAIALDVAGNLYIADTNNSAVREVNAGTGIITTLAGNGSTCVSQSGDGGPSTGAALCLPQSIAIDSSGDIYIAEPGWNRVRKAMAPALPPTTATATPVLSVMAGTYVNPQTVSITDSTPGAAFYVAMNPAAPIAGSNPAVPFELLEPSYYNGPVNITGTATLQVVAVAPGYLPSTTLTAAYTITTPPTTVIKTVAGNGISGFSGMSGPATSASLGDPEGLALDASGNLYFTDPQNNVVWKVAKGTGTITVVAGNGSQGYAGDGGPAASAEFYEPSAVVVDKAGNLYIADTYNNLVREVAANTGVITTIAGVHNEYATPGHNGDGGLASAAYLSEPEGLAFDTAGNLYIAESGEGSVRMISASTGVITTIAGGVQSGITETNANNGDGGLATKALLGYVKALAFDSAGNLYIADSGRVRMVAAASSIISTVAGNGDSGSSGDGSLALNAEVAPESLAVDAANNLYISNSNYTVRKVTASTGVITTVAGNGFFNFSGDGGSPTVAGMDGPQGIAFDGDGNLYIADQYHYRIREVSSPGPAATPTFSVAAGSYNSVQSVSITDSTPNATIYFTTDGSTPTTGSSLYNGTPITVSTTETLQAIALASGYTESAVASASYTIKIPSTPPITWATPSAITYGTALGASQLDASSTVAGSFVYSPAAGTVLNAGTQTLSVTLTPTDSTDYTTATATVQLIVNKATPTVTVTPSAASIQSNQSVNVTVSVGWGAGDVTPSGSVMLTSGGYSSAATALNGGNATVTIPAGSLSVGADALTVVYTPDNAGSSTYTSATGSAAISVSAQTKLGSTVTAVPAVTLITNLQAVNVSIAVAGVSGQAVPTGTVTLSAGSYSAQQTLANGEASFTIPAGTLSNGTNTLSANYAGDGTYAGSSATATVTVAAVLIAAPAPPGVIPGASTTTTLTITAGSNYSGTMNLGCALTTSPSGAQSLPTCSISPASLVIAADGTGTAKLTVNTTAQSGSAMMQPSRNNLWGLAGGTAIAGVLLLGFPARRRRWMSLVLLFGALATAMVGCGGGSGGGGGGGGGGNIVPATTAGTYVFTVTGTDSANSSITASTTVTVTVQ